MRARVAGAALAAALAAAACSGSGDAPSFAIDALTPPPTRTAPLGDLDVLTVSVGGADLLVEVASTAAQRQAGLSGRGDLGRFDGMLFHPDAGRMTSLWMKGMLFDLDFVWVGPDCEVVDIHERVPAPERPGAAVPIHRPGALAAWVIEIASGRAAELGIVVGQRVRFDGSVMGRAYGCEG